MKRQIFKYLAVAAIAVSAALVTSCDDDDKDNKDAAVTFYTLITTANPLTDGIVTRSPNKEKYTAEDKVTIMAIAYDGFIFDGWENGDTQASIEITMDANKTYTAKFKSDEEKCEDSEEGDDEMQMSMIAVKSEVTIWLKGTGDATVYWGNETSETHTINLFTVTKYSHDYSTSSPRTITISGKNITYLECVNNQLTALDVSKNTALTRLDCVHNLLTALDVSKNTALTELHCNSNQLTGLDVSKNTALTYLYCHNNQLTALDVSGTTALIGLYCFYNRLAALDVSGTTALTVLDCDGNRLTVLDVSKNPALMLLNFSSNQLTALDVSKNPELKYLIFSNNQLTALDVSENTVLTELWCISNQFTTDALNDLFGTLHNNSGSKTIWIKDNLGTATCTKSMAIEKGWTVNDYSIYY